MNGLLVFLCSNSMSRFFLIGRIIQVADIGLAFTLFTSAYVASPPKGMLRRYSLGARAKLLLPSKGWQNVVRSDDLEALRRFRKGLFVCGGLFLGWNTLTVFYFGLSARLLLMLARGQCG
jgi:hypothetical protein